MARRTWRRPTFSASPLRGVSFVKRPPYGSERVLSRDISSLSFRSPAASPNARATHRDVLAVPVPLTIKQPASGVGPRRAHGRTGEPAVGVGLLGGARRLGGASAV